MSERESEKRGNKRDIYFSPHPISLDFCSGIATIRLWNALMEKPTAQPLYRKAVKHQMVILKYNDLYF
jgi:hypothetical protein